MTSNIFLIEIIEKSNWKQKFCEMNTLTIMKIAAGLLGWSKSISWLILKCTLALPHGIFHADSTLLAILMIKMGCGIQETFVQ